jgi:NADPH-dependent 2,4-dienoyl-CoA reductase/sulfur reductase-like enzyme
MSRVMRQRFEVLVVGGGPAGMAAAVGAAESGQRVGIVDDNAALGGQIWRGESEAGSEASRWTERLRSSGASVLRGRIFYQPEPYVLLAEADDLVQELSYRKLILATGARERFLPFPGWTLPNVMGAGGLQAMVKCGLPIQGKRVVVAGTGPLLLAVAAYLRRHGAEIAMICEQASWASLGRFGMALIAQPSKIFQGFQLKRELAGTRFSPNSWPVAASGTATIESVTISRSEKLQTIPCDYLACGFHLVPNIEVPLMLGCEIQDGCVRVDDLQRTSVAEVFCAGEPTGIGGVELSLVEGEIAGLAAAGRIAEASILFDKRKKLRFFAKRLDRTFRLRSELRDLPQAETIVCRCEDVRYSHLRDHMSWRAAKLQTRCGMGACQGRVCGPVTQFLFKWNPDSVRPPIFPARVESLAGAGDSKQELCETTGGRR